MIIKHFGKEIFKYFENFDYFKFLKIFHVWNFIIFKMDVFFIRNNLIENYLFDLIYQYWPLFFIFNKFNKFLPLKTY